ncbi:MAG: glycosyltransferase family 4 protein, partial [Coriobacteriia bacterium]|nr:glycosyltransferase family 4 protein [Coriobacteriia bacterium]
MGSEHPTLPNDSVHPRTEDRGVNPYGHGPRGSPAVRVVVEAYACSPGRGSEPGNGWNWPLHLAHEGCDVTVLTIPRWRDSIEPVLAHTPVTMQVEYMPVSEWPLRLGWMIGSKLQYLLWLRTAARRARDLHESLPFDVAHHVSYGSLAGGTRLWGLGIPLVLGPVGGGQVAPPSMRPYFGRQWPGEVIRSFVVKYVIPHSPFTRRACRAADLVLTSNEQTAELARRLGARNVRISAPDSGLPVGYGTDRVPNRVVANGMRLVWVGRIFAIKALPLALDALELVDDPAVTLDVLGGGTGADQVERWIGERGLADRVRYHGAVDWERVRDFYRSSDVMLFTSVRDSCAAQLLEAMAFGLPIIALDHQGTSSA